MPAHTYVKSDKHRHAYCIPVHEVTKAQLPGWDRHHQRDNAYELARSWGEDAILKMFDANPEEVAYSARCAAHFYNLAQRFRS